jgi:hypothetical protein
MNSINFGTHRKSEFVLHRIVSLVCFVQTYFPNHYTYLKQNKALIRLLDDPGKDFFVTISLMMMITAMSLMITITVVMGAVVILTPNRSSNKLLDFQCVLIRFLLIMFFWVWAPCGLAGRSQRFGETYCLHLQTSLCPDRLFPSGFPSCHPK